MFKNTVGSPYLRMTTAQRTDCPSSSYIRDWSTYSGPGLYSGEHLACSVPLLPIDQLQGKRKYQKVAQ